ncbi:hypothetical protein V9T40_001723 [Parthenolecanium corni]|uniref:Uncharacterized protein n=1 Tax=Parthenolecanium corni TaxID=536013 RepID=A0AAN9THM0_9HEMI
MLVHSLIWSLLVVGALAAPAENSKSASAAKPAVDAKDADQKSAAPLAEQDKARTHHLLSLLQPRPSVGYPIPVSSFNSWSSYPQIQSAPISASYFETAPAAAYAPFKVGPVPQFHVVPAAPVHVAPVPSVAQVHVPAPTISQTTYTKPVVSYTPQVVKKPSLMISQQVVHQPVINEYQQIIRRPVIAEVQEVIHKPYLTEYQQVIRLPTQTAHIIKKPTFSSYQHETVQKPIYLNSEQYHIVDKPSSQVLQLPTQYVQPYTTEVVHVPSVHHQTETQTTVHQPPAVAVPAVPAVPVHTAPAPAVSSVSYLPSASYGISSFGSGYDSSLGYGSGLSYGSGLGYGTTLGSGYGSSYGSSLGSSYGSSLGSSFSGFQDETYGVYLSPSTCRGGDCQVKRDAEGREIVVMPNSGYTNQEMVPMSYSQYNPNILSTPAMSNLPMYWPNNLPLFKNTQNNGDNSQPPQARASDDYGNQIDSQQTFEQPANTQIDDSVIPKFAETLLSNPEFQKIVSETYAKTQESARSAETENKVKDLWNTLSDDEKTRLRSMMDEKMKQIEAEKNSSTTPAADQKSESSKQ